MPTLYLSNVQGFKVDANKMRREGFVLPLFPIENTLKSTVTITKSLDQLIIASHPVKNEQT